MCMYIIRFGGYYCEYVSYLHFQQSWSDKTIERVRNVIKTDNRKARQAGDFSSSSLPAKCQKKVQDTELTRRYPVVATNMDIEDPLTVNKHQAAITEELAKAKPRDTVLLPLLKTTTVREGCSLSTVLLASKMLRPTTLHLTDQLW